MDITHEKELYHNLFILPQMFPHVSIALEGLVDIHH